jgi:outer membrane protein TolC
MAVNAWLESRYALATTCPMREKPPTRRTPGCRRAALVVLLPPLVLLSSCWTPEGSRQSADEEVYPILRDAAALVTGEAKTFPLERPVDRLRQRLLEGGEDITLNLAQALDVAAENSREFQRQKEQLYLAALNLTRERHDFAVRFAGGGSAEVSGIDDDSADVFLGDDLSASANTESGGRIVASFVNTFLRSVLGGQGFDGSSILNLAFTQPLLRGAGRRIVREPLTQAERDVIYQMRAFERYRATFAVEVVSAYYGIVQQMQDLQNVRANYESVRQSRIRTAAEYEAGRRTISDLGREQQSELSAQSNIVRTENQLASSLDRFKLTLGLPVTARVNLDAEELQNLENRGVPEFALDEDIALQLALTRRYDHATTVDRVEDAGRRVLVSEDALGMALDFSAALNVPDRAGASMNLDWSKVRWSAGFNLDLALDKLAERNAYRQSLITLDAQIRAREESEDSISSAIRRALRDIQSAYDTYRIEIEAVKVAERRVDSTTELYAADRTQALEVLDAKDSLLSSQLRLTAAIVDYAIARLELLRDLEGIALEPKGLRFDPALPLPSLPAEESP